MEETIIYDLAGIGIGPFNLGLAALCVTTSLKTIFFDACEEFNWHPGMMLNDATLQVPFYADLVTPVDPCSRFSFMAFLHAKKKMFRFAILEEYFIRRKEYNEYCRWVVAQLPNLRFGCRCDQVTYDDKHQIFIIKTAQGNWFARKIVVGVGAVPYLPVSLPLDSDRLAFHSAEYLFKKKQLLKKERVAIIGSGQSAAEIFHDLLQCHSGELNWFTRSDSFFPMDYSKFALEKASLDYIDYFYSLPEQLKATVLRSQDNLYKGINKELITAIYRLLNDDIQAMASLQPCCELLFIDQKLNLSFRHTQLSRNFLQQVDAVILATGYRSVIPTFLNGIHHLINWAKENVYAVNRNYSVDKGTTIFVQNADAHSHGFNAADLGMGPYRNATILNAILGHDHFILEKGIAFQNFGLSKIIA